MRNKRFSIKYMKQLQYSPEILQFLLLPSANSSYLEVRQLPLADLGDVSLSLSLSRILDAKRAFNRKI